MFISGLGHVLSISGYHMAVVAGVVFFAVRALLALIPALTVSFPIKKWAAATALAAAAFYLLLSGCDVATQRSFFMTAVVLIAVIVDRRAVTFRTLAVAAMIVLALVPEALVHPSFQMSFAATLALPQPDILISGDGHNVGVRGKDGRLHLMRTAKDAFLLKEWLAADADSRLPTDPSLPRGVSCDEAGCVTQLADGALVALALRPDALADDCERAALVVTARQPPPACPPPVIDLDRLRRQGAMALQRTRNGFAVAAVKPKGVDRPWSPAVEGGGDNETTLTPRPEAPRAIDATPPEAEQQTDE
jgi:ComEC/Rec2-related protein